MTKSNILIKQIHFKSIFILNMAFNQECFKKICNLYMHMCVNIYIHIAIIIFFFFNYFIRYYDVCVALVLQEKGQTLINNINL